MQIRKTLLLAGVLGFALAGSHAAKADWHHDGGGYGDGGGWDHRGDDGDRWRHHDWHGGYYPPPPVYYAPPPVYYAPPPVYYAPPPPRYYAPPPVYYAPGPVITFGFRP
jgi:hypothetical protein